MWYPVNKHFKNIRECCVVSSPFVCLFFFFTWAYIIGSALASYKFFRSDLLTVRTHELSISIAADYRELAPRLNFLVCFQAVVGVHEIQRGEYVWTPYWTVGRTGTTDEGRGRRRVLLTSPSPLEFCPCNYELGHSPSLSRCIIPLFCSCIIAHRIFSHPEFF